jgi:centromeric protein E
MERIYVAVRVRPLINQEVVKGNYWRVEDNHISLHNALGTPISGYSYTFDHVFGYNSKNVDIYEVHTKDVIEAAVNGFNGTVFAYGQTSSGKTYTMQGSQEDLGIIRLSVYNVFKNIQSISDREFLIRVSYMEIYNEEINDLLAPENKKLQVHENLEV